MFSSSSSCYIHHHRQTTNCLQSACDPQHHRSKCTAEPEARGTQISSPINTCHKTISRGFQGDSRIDLIPIVLRVSTKRRRQLYRGRNIYISQVLTLVLNTFHSRLHLDEISYSFEESKKLQPSTQMHIARSYADVVPYHNPVLNKGPED